jgi:hypothetical protein
MRAALLIVLGLTAGCYSYFPLTTATPNPGTSVTVRLTDAGARELERTLGSDVFLINGRYVSAGDSGFAMSVGSVETKGGDRHAWSGEAVTVPMADIASVDVRRLAKTRTILLAGVGVASVAVTTMAFALTGGGTPQGSVNRPPPQ